MSSTSLHTTKRKQDSMNENKDAIDSLSKALKKKNTDRFEVGDVIKWTAAGRYTYAAIKTGAGWFTTASTRNAFVDSKLDDYEELVEILGRFEVSNIEVSTSWASI